MPIFGGGKKEKKSKAVTAIEELLVDADKSLKSGDLDKAASEYRRAHRYLYREENIAENPDSYSLLFTRTGHGLFETGEPDRAVECFDKATQLNPHNVDAWMSRGIVHMKTGAMLNYAVMCFEEVLKHEPNNLEAMENKVEALLLSKKQDEAAELLERMIKIAPANESYKKKLQSLSPMDLESVTAKLKKNPKDPELWRKRAEFLVAAGNVAEAIEAYLRLAYLSKDTGIYNKVLELNPNNMTAVDKLLEVNPDDVPLLLKKATYLRSDGKPDEALSIYENVLGLEPGNAEAAQAVQELRPPESEPEIPLEPEVAEASPAEPAFEPEPVMVETAPEPIEIESVPEPQVITESSPEAEIVLVAAEPELDDAPEPVAEETVPEPAFEPEPEPVVEAPAPVTPVSKDPYRARLEALPNDSDLHVEAGDYYFENDELDKALVCFKKAVEISPQDTVALHNMGSVLFVMQRYDEVVTAFDRIIAIDSEDTSAYLTKGAALFKAGKYDESIQALNNVVKRDMNDAAAWYYKASAEAMKGNMKLVVPFLTRSAEIEDEFRERAKTDPSFEKVRDTPEFQAVVNK